MATGVYMFDILDRRRLHISALLLPWWASASRPDTA